MNMTLDYLLAGAAIIATAVTTVVDAAGQSPAGESLSMIEIVQRLEKDGFGPFTELDMDAGKWEVEARKQDQPLELTVDPVSGNVLSEHRDDAEQAPPASAMVLSKLLQAVSDVGGYQNFDEVSFERRYWEIEVFKDGQKHELHVDPMTAKVITDRIDD